MAGVLLLLVLLLLTPQPYISTDAINTNKIRFISDFASCSSENHMRESSVLTLL